MRDLLNCDPITMLLLIVFPTIQALEARVTIIPSPPLNVMVLGEAFVSEVLEKPIRASELSVTTIPSSWVVRYRVIDNNRISVRKHNDPVPRSIFDGITVYSWSPPKVHKDPIPASILDGIIQYCCPGRRNHIYPVLASLNGFKIFQSNYSRPYPDGSYGVLSGAWISAVELPSIVIPFVISTFSLQIPVTEMVSPETAGH